MSPELRDQLHNHFDQARSNATGQEEVQESPFAPNHFQVAPKHPQHQHVDENVPNVAVKENVSKGLPNAQTRKHSARNQSEDLRHVVVGVEGIGEQAHQRLDGKDAGAYQDDEF